MSEQPKFIQQIYSDADPKGLLLCSKCRQVLYDYESDLICPFCGTEETVPYDVIEDMVNVYFKGGIIEATREGDETFLSISIDS